MALVAAKEMVNEKSQLKKIEDEELKELRRNMVNKVLKVVQVLRWHELSRVGMRCGRPNWNFDDKKQNPKCGCMICFLDEGRACYWCCGVQRIDPSSFFDKPKRLTQQLNLHLSKVFHSPVLVVAEQEKAKETDIMVVDLLQKPKMRKHQYPQFPTLSSEHRFPTVQYDASIMDHSEWKVFNQEIQIHRKTCDLAKFLTISYRKTGKHPTFGWKLQPKDMFDLDSIQPWLKHSARCRSCGYVRDRQDLCFGQCCLVCPSKFREAQFIKSKLVDS